MEWMWQERQQKICLTKTNFACSLRIACLWLKGARVAVHVYHERGVPNAVLLTQVKQKRSETRKIRL